MFDAHLGSVIVKGLDLTALKDIAAREDNAMVFRECDAGESDAVDTCDGAREGVEHEVTPVLLTEGFDFAQKMLASPSAWFLSSTGSE